MTWAHISASCVAPGKLFFPFRTLAWSSVRWEQWCYLWLRGFNGLVPFLAQVPLVNSGEPDCQESTPPMPGSQRALRAPIFHLLSLSLPLPTPQERPAASSPCTYLGPAAEGGHHSQSPSPSVNDTSPWGKLIVRSEQIESCAGPPGSEGPEQGGEGGDVFHCGSDPSLGFFLWLLLVLLARQQMLFRMAVSEGISQWLWWDKAYRTLMRIFISEASAHGGDCFFSYSY